MNYQRNRLLSQLRKDLEVVSKQNGELVSENAKLRQLNALAQTSSPELLKELEKSKDLYRASAEKVERLEDENKELREHIDKLKGVTKKKIDQGPKTGRRGKRSGTKLQTEE